MGNKDSMTAGPPGPALLQDYCLHEKLAHFNHEHVPGRVVDANGTGANGTFTVTGDITRYTRARLLGIVDNKCRTFLRFPTVGGETGGADTVNDTR